MRATIRRRALLVLAVTGVLVLSGCRYDGINSLSLPGTAGTGSDHYTVTVQLPDAANLVPNTPVRVGDLNIGTVTAVSLDGWTPTLTLEIGKEVVVPANATATLGQTSLLGSKHVELAPPVGVAPEGRLGDGDVIGIDRAGKFPETEEVLAATSTLLNGGGLQHVQTITDELNRALGGREQTFRSLLEQLDTTVTGLDEQKADIVAALQGMDRLGAGLNEQTPAIEEALRTLPAGLEALRQEEPELVRALQELGRWGDATRPFADQGVPELRGVFREIEGPLREIAAAKPGLMPTLRLLPFVVFPLDSIDNVFRGDYFQFNPLVVNLTLASLDKALLTGTPAEGSLLAVEEALREGRAPTALQATDPLQLPAPGPPSDQASTPAPAPAPTVDQGGLVPLPAPAPAPDAPNDHTPSDQSRDPGLLGGLLGN